MIYDGQVLRLVSGRRNIYQYGKPSVISGDDSFELSTYQNDLGVLIGTSAVRVTRPTLAVTDCAPVFIPICVKF